MPISFTTRASRRRFITSSITVAAIMPLALRQAMAAGRKLNVYNFDTYIGETTVADFSKAAGVEVHYDLYADNAELFARLREGNPGYDMVCPTNDTLERMILADMLLPIDHAKIPNFKNIEPRFFESTYDKGRKFSAPYFWGTTGIGYHQKDVAAVLGDQKMDSWKYVYGDDSEKFKGKIAWASDAPMLIGAGLKLLGYSLNSTKEDELKQVEALLMKNKKNARTIAGDNGQDLLLAHDVALAVDYNGDILQVHSEDADIHYVCPKEGVQLWEDSWALPKGGKNTAEAHEFINYILTPEIHASIAKVTNYALPNAEAKKLMPADYINNKAIFPDEAVIKASETAQYLGEAAAEKYTEMITRIRAE